MSPLTVLVACMVPFPGFSPLRGWHMHEGRTLTLARYLICHLGV